MLLRTRYMIETISVPPAELVVLTSGDNYCVNNENGKVYYWSSSEDSYYYIAESIDEFASFFR